jgi:large subunit ribosomal protein L6
MSRIGKEEIKIPKSVTVTAKGKTLFVKGPKGELSFDVFDRISFELLKKGDENKLIFKRPSESGPDTAFHGTARALVANMVQGVTEGFKKELEIIGVGFRGEQKKNGVNLLLGYSHPIFFEPPAGITVKMEGNNKIVVSGIDKQQVGQTAAVIRDFRKPEPYKGKGIRYANEYVRRKEVKKA